MASSYLTLVNNVLRDLNEVELTSSTFSSSRGIQTSTKGYINRAISDLINAELNWSFTRAEGSLPIIAGKQLYDKTAISSSLKYVDYDTMFLEPKDFITNGDYEVSGSASITGWTTVSGTPSASTKFGNTLLLSSAVATQQIDDLIVGEEYIVVTQVTGSTATLKIGTSSNGSQTATATLTVSNTNETVFTETTFTATASTHFITFEESSGNNAHINTVSLTENDTAPKRLEYISYEEWTSRFREADSVSDKNKFDVPEYVFTTYNEEVGVSPIPIKSNSVLKFDYYITHTDLSDATDTSIIPTRFENVITNRAKYYAYTLRGEIPNAQLAQQDFENGIKRMRVELINRKNYMRAV
tara:strand:- start:233 stop:1300 length:1068 start_codon:yes stop_codon:yes gene_type:complete